MDISVIVCTYNRAISLTRCLAHLSAQVVPSGVTWEVIVVDNNSTDSTRQVVLKAAENGFSVCYVREEKQGLCYARNRGIEESQGRIIAYIDDDILVEPNWLRSMLLSFEETGCDAAGGRIYLETGGCPLPGWLGPILFGYLGYIDYGEERIDLDGRRCHPHGGNMAFRREVFERIGLFDVNVGRVGNKLFKGSETELFWRLSNTDARIIYEPHAKVHHIIKTEELTKRHFRILQIREGEQRAKRDTTVYPRQIIGIPLFIVREFEKAFRRYITAPFRDSCMRFRREMDLWNLIGYARGRYGLYRQGGII